MTARIRFRGLGELVTRPAWSWMRAVCRSCDITVVAGSWLESELKQQRCQRVRTVPFGIRHRDFDPLFRSESLRERFLGDTHAQALLFLIAGRLAADKRQARLVDAVVRLSKRRAVGLVVLGDGPERKRLEERAKELEHVNFLPFTRDRGEYAALLASADVLLHGSPCETYGFTIAETLASGTPAVVPDAGGARALVSSDCAQIYSATGTASDVEVAVERLLTRPMPALREAARRRASREPELEEHFRLLFDEYRGLLERPRGLRPAV